MGNFLPGYKDGADSHLVSITESDVFAFSYLFLQMFESLKSNQLSKIQLKEKGISSYVEAVLRGRGMEGHPM